jgi:hypothetical protein
MYDLAGASQSLPSMILPPLPTGKRFYGAIIDTQPMVPIWMWAGIQSV